MSMRDTGCVTITKLQVHRATGRDLSVRLLDAVTNLVIIHNVTVSAVVTLSRVLSISDRERLFFVRDRAEGGGEEEWQPRESVSVTYRREVGRSLS